MADNQIIMDIVRSRFLEKQLNLIPEIVSIIRDYDSIYRDYFSNKVLNSLNLNVNLFWDAKLVSYANKRSNMYNSNYTKMLDYYYDILRNVVPLYYDNDLKFIF